MKIGDRVRPIKLEEDEAHLNPGTVTYVPQVGQDAPGDMIRVLHDDGYEIWHTIDQIEAL